MFDMKGYKSLMKRERMVRCLIFVVLTTIGMDFRKNRRIIDLLVRSVSQANTQWTTVKKLIIVLSRTR